MGAKGSAHLRTINLTPPINLTGGINIKVRRGPARRCLVWKVLPISQGGGHGAAALARHPVEVEAPPDPAGGGEPRQILAEPIAEIHHRGRAMVLNKPARFENTRMHPQMAP